MIRFLVAAILSGVMCLAHATDYTGKIVAIRSHQSPTSSGFVRVSIQISGTTNCSNPFWYSYELADGPTAAIWQGTLLNALTSGRSVRIVGAGTCDPYGVETVSYIDAL